MDKKVSNKEVTMQVVKFVLFSISAGIIQMASFSLLNELIKWQYWPSYLIALTLSVLWNFTLNREFTFKSATNIPLAMLKVAGFYLVFTPLSTLWGQGLANVGWNEYLVLGFTMVINMVTEFLFCKYLVYSKSINTNKRAKKQKVGSDSQVLGQAVVESAEQKEIGSEAAVDSNVKITDTKN